MGGERIVEAVARAIFEADEADDAAGYDSLARAAIYAIDASGLPVQPSEEAVALAKLDPGGCREWVGGDRCGAPSEFVLWGKLIPPEGLGPRCYDHAAQHVGHGALGDPAWAIMDLRPLRAALSVPGGVA